MKNEDLPIIQALKGRAKPKPFTSFDQFEAPRTFEVKHEEIPGLPGRKVGEPITVNLSGSVHSQHADGRTIMKVDSVKPDSEEMEQKENPDDTELKVRSQESHAP